ARAVLFHASSVLCVALIHAVGGNPSVTLMLGGLLMTYVYLALGWREARSSTLSLNLLSFYFFWYSTCLGSSAIYVLLLTSAGNPIAFVDVHVWPEDVAAGYVIFLVGSVALHAGIQRFRPIENDESVGEMPDVANGVVSLVLLYAVGLVGLSLPSLLIPLGSL